MVRVEKGVVGVLIAEHEEDDSVIGVEHIWEELDEIWIGVKACEMDDDEGEIMEFDRDVGVWEKLDNGEVELVEFETTWDGSWGMGLSGVWLMTMNWHALHKFNVCSFLLSLSSPFHASIE